MARINRTDVIQKAVNDLALSPSTDKVPTETLDKVQLTYSLNRQFSSFLLSATGNTSGTITITPQTPSAGGEIYLTGISFSYMKDATCDQATGRIGVTVTPDFSNVATVVGAFSCITLVADAQSQYISFPFPLKLKAGTTITMNSSYTVGTMARNMSVTGFITSSN